MSLPPATVYVLLTSCNRGGYFRQAVDSVLEQTYRDFHLLIVDDASDDGSADVAREYEQASRGRVTALCKAERRGYVDSMNVGLSMLRNVPYVALHNDDDVWHPRKLEMQMRAVARQPAAGFIATDAIIINERSEPQDQRFAELYGKLDLAHPAKHIFWHGNCICAASVVVTRPGLELVAPYPDREGGCNDMAMWLTISARMPVAWVDEPLTYYRHSESQMSKRNSRAMVRETYTLRERLLTESPEVYTAVGGNEARRRLDRDAVRWAGWSLRLLDWENYRWYAWKALKRKSPGVLGRLVYVTVRSMPVVALRSIAGSRPQKDSRG